MVSKKEIAKQQILELQFEKDCVYGYLIENCTVRFRIDSVAYGVSN